MATKLPLRSEFETWNSRKVACFLSQNGMKDCALTVERMKINGQRFLNLSDSDLQNFHLIHQPQLQKMVHDIKKNDGGLMNKFRKLRIKNLPTVPPRDYNPDDDEQDEEQWSENEFDSDYENPDTETYEVPSEENDENYEPPPMVKKSVTPAFSQNREEYADNISESTKQPPRKPFPIPASSMSKSRFSNVPQKASVCTKPFPPKPQLEESDDNDYVCPRDEEDDDNNYIEPNEEPPSATPHAPPVINRRLKPKTQNAGHTARKDDNPDVYEVPDLEDDSPPVMRKNKSPPKTIPCLLPKVENRQLFHGIKKAPVPETADDEEYEVCDPDDSHSTANGFSKPIPQPRETRKPAIPAKPEHQQSSSLKSKEDLLKPNFLPRPHILPNKEQKPALPILTLPKIPQPKQSTSSLTKNSYVLRKNNLPGNGADSTEMEAGVYNKPWYASSSDRKIAEEALVKLNKDGSFLVRKSSGQDAKQPFTLVVFYKGKVYNIPVRCIQSSRQYALGKEKTGEERFNSVADIIENHQWSPLVLIDSQNNTKDSTKLKHPVKV
ncbi:B-cell linker protein isoform X33 [Erpetoichthys calabaricus]|uniref:B-cell linker protein isoform X33 n=2 Tax=Erpetoichthys calabaricus TaxID=27687 RepID=UPI002234524F|nr:B-cell linker protein isoform X33 [Erpetoichthys calabaricus]